MQVELVGTALIALPTVLFVRHRFVFGVLMTRATHSSWDEFKFQLKHRKDLKRVAVVGDARWEKWASMVSRIFTGADVRYFDQDQAEEASTWIESGW